MGQLPNYVYILGGTLTQTEKNGFRESVNNEDKDNAAYTAGKKGHTWDDQTMQ